MTFVLICVDKRYTHGEKTKRILGCYSLSMAEIHLDNLP